MKTLKSLSILMIAVGMSACGPGNGTTVTQKSQGPTSKKQAAEQRVVRSDTGEVITTDDELQTIRSEIGADTPPPAPAGPTKPETVQTITKIATTAAAVVGVSTGDVGTYVALGVKAFDLIRKNRSVVDIKTQQVSVLPADENVQRQMSNWQPVTKSFERNFKNYFGGNIVSMKYTIHGNFGGMADGRGFFMKNVTVLPTIKSYPFWNVTSSVKISEPINVGSPEVPRVAVEVEIHWKLSSFHGQSAEGFDVYIVRGDGLITQKVN